jgi:hypothetical protein
LWRGRPVMGRRFAAEAKNSGVHSWPRLSLTSNLPKKARGVGMPGE